MLLGVSANCAARTSLCVYPHLGFSDSLCCFGVWPVRFCLGVWPVRFCFGVWPACPPGFTDFPPDFCQCSLLLALFISLSVKFFFFEQSRHVTRLRRHRFAAEWWRGASGGQTPTALWFNICAIGSAHVVGRGTPCARDFGVSATNLPSVFTSSAVRALVFFSVGFLLDDWRVWEI